MALGFWDGHRVPSGCKCGHLITARTFLLGGAEDPGMIDDLFREGSQIATVMGSVCGLPGDQYTLFREDRRNGRADAGLTLDAKLAAVPLHQGHAQR